jgi:biotin carboxylase
MRKRRLLLIAPTTTYRLNDFLNAAQKLAIEVILASNRCHRLAELWPDHHKISAPFSSAAKAAEKILFALKNTPIDAVLPVDDETTELAARLAQKCNLPGNSLKSTKLTRNKYSFRCTLSENGLLSPRFRLVAIDSDPERFFARNDLSFPSVLKPLFLSASRGVIRANNKAEWIAAFNRIGRLLRQKEFFQKRGRFAKSILIEEYIEGQEYAIEGLLTNGRLHILAIFDKPDPLTGPFFEETIYVTPSRLSPEMQIRVRHTLENACRVLGLQHGPVHAEARINAGGIFLIEVAPRTIGGLCARTLKFASGMSLEELVIRHAFGEEIENSLLQERASGVMMIPIPCGGVLDEVHGLENARAVPGIEEIEITIKPGNLAIPLPEGASYLGFIFATGHTPAEVEKSLRQAHAHLQFDIRPSLEVVGDLE